MGVVDQPVVLCYNEGKVFLDPMVPDNAKPHPVHTDYYITPEGAVWSSLSNKFLSQYNTNKKLSYKCVGGKFGSKNKVLVHRLVAETFIPNPHNLTDVNHINGDKTDNSVSNLEWSSHEDNVRHAWQTGLMTNSGVQNKYLWSVMVCATGEIIETLSLRSLERIFNIRVKRLDSDYRKGYKSVSTPLKVISRRVVDKP